MTPDVLEPFLVEIDTTYKDESLVIYITVNTMHMRNYMSQKTTNYTLTFESRTYKNRYTVLHDMVGYNQLKFIIPTTRSYNQNDVITFTLMDHLHNRIYRDIKSCVSIPPPTKQFNCRTSSVYRVSPSPKRQHDRVLPVHPDRRI